MIVARRVNPDGEGYVIRLQPTTVEAWSTTRLPFEPRGWLIEFRHDLRTALSEMAAPDNNVLHAIYAGAATRAVDVENVLLYNLGAKALRHLARGGIRFESAPDPPPPPVDTLRDPGVHYHRYALTPPGAALIHWIPGRALASFDDVELGQPNRIAPIFTAIRRTASPPALLETSPPRFGVRIAIRGPEAGASRLVDLVKPLLDGVVSAYHCHDGSAMQDILMRLDRLGLGPANELGQDLLDSRWNLLGSRRLLWPFRDGVQWNPADHLCLAADISIEPGARSNWLISGAIVELDEKRPSRRENPDLPS